MRSLGNIAVSAALLIAFSPLAAFAANSEIHFSADGNFVAKNILVYQKAGTNLFCRGTWGTTFIRFVVTTSPATAITKKHGEQATVGDIGEKDIIDVEGRLATGGDSIVVNASTIRNASLETDVKSLSGKIVSIDTSARSLVVNDKSFGKTTITIGSAVIMKGVRSITLADIKVGDTVASAQGVYDYSTKTLTASVIGIYQDPAFFKPRNFEGALKSISATQLPSTFVVTVQGTDYTVYMDAKGSVLNKHKGAASLSRFVVGDKVRFYGTLREANITEVDVEVIRDLNF